MMPTPGLFLFLMAASVAIILLGAVLSAFGIKPRPEAAPPCAPGFLSISLPEHGRACVVGYDPGGRQ